MMEIFVNECSFHEQLYEQRELVNAFKQFFTLLNQFNQRNATYMLYHHENLFTIYRVIGSEPLIASLNNLPDKSLRRAVKGVLFNKLNAQDWQNRRVHSSDDFFLCMDDVVTDTSIAELAERKLQKQEMIGLLLNFPKSKFASLRALEISKNEQILLNLDCLDDKPALTEWLSEQLQSEQFDYDPASTVPPTDLQTVLRDGFRFQSTTHYVQGRRVYREIKVEQYWYVDNLHYGLAAHLEVFDHSGSHLGEATLDGQLDVSKRDSRKGLKL